MHNKIKCCCYNKSPTIWINKQQIIKLLSSAFFAATILFLLCCRNSKWNQYSRTQYCCIDGWHIVVTYLWAVSLIFQWIFFILNEIAIDQPANLSMGIHTERKQKTIMYTRIALSVLVLTIFDHWDKIFLFYINSRMQTHTHSESEGETCQRVQSLPFDMWKQWTMFMNLLNRIPLCASK